MFDFFYSDPHFGHDNIIQFCGRPFADVTAMNHELVHRYNARVRQDQIVLWTGDCFFGSPKEFAVLLKAMNGAKVLVRGNHDYSGTRMKEVGFSEVHKSLEFEMEGHKFRAQHHPIRPEQVGGPTIVHGHTHSPSKGTSQSVHVGVDAWDYYPVSKAEVLAIVREEVEYE